MARFIDELKEINAGLGEINQNEEILINAIKKSIIGYVKEQGMNGEYTSFFEYSYDTIKTININKVIKYMKEVEGLETFSAYINENKHHDIFVRHWFRPEIWFSVNFKNLK